jgi:uncharacterized protein with NRDE domain
MCLAAWAVARHPRFPWLLATNRDEFLDRLAEPMGWWTVEPGGRVLGGRDRSGGGTWLGLREDGRLAWLTNVREPGRFEAGLPSRGALVVEALQAAQADAAWLHRAAATPRNGFNLVVAELAQDRFVWTSNRPQPQHRAGGAGVWGLSNAMLETPWPKVSALKGALERLLDESPGVDGLFAGALVALSSRDTPPDEALPRTGVPMLRERQLAPAFIRIPGDSPATGYGTRCSTVCVVEALDNGRRRVHLLERRFDPEGHPAGESREWLDLP